MSCAERPRSFFWYGVDGALEVLRVANGIANLLEKLTERLKKVKHAASWGVVSLVTV
jgi:hypothetical protein